MADTLEAQRAATLVRNKMQRPTPKAPQLQPSSPVGRGGVRQSASPSYTNRALRLGKSLATGGRDKQASLDKQLAGAATARTLQALGAASNAILPGAGTILAPVGKRAGRILGEHWPIVLAFIGVFAIILFCFVAGFFFTIIDLIMKWTPL